LFLREHVEAGEIDPCELLVTARADRAAVVRFPQRFWCHAGCASATLRGAVVTREEFHAGRPELEADRD
jgi:hypothetical protein